MHQDFYKFIIPGMIVGIRASKEKNFLAVALNQESWLSLCEKSAAVESLLAKNEEGYITYLMLGNDSFDPLSFYYDFSHYIGLKNYCSPTLTTPLEIARHLHSSFETSMSIVDFLSGALGKSIIEDLRILKGYLEGFDPN